MSLSRSIALFAPIALVSSIFAATQVPAQSANGAVLFQQRCAACHSVAAGGAGGVGPNLKGVIGRKAGTAKFNYSAAMVKSGAIWNAANLDKFIAAPTKALPGTKMVIGVTDVVQRKAIIGYLATQR